MLTAERATSSLSTSHRPSFLSKSPNQMNSSRMNKIRKKEKDKNHMPNFSKNNVLKNRSNQIQLFLYTQRRYPDCTEPGSTHTQQRSTGPSPCAMSCIFHLKVLHRRSFTRTYAGYDKKWMNKNWPVYHVNGRIRRLPITKRHVWGGAIYTKRTTW